MQITDSILTNGDLLLEIEFDDKEEKKDLLTGSHSYMVNSIMDNIEYYLVDPNELQDLTDKDMITDEINYENEPSLWETNIWVYNTPYNMFVDLVNDGKVKLTQRGKLVS